jgi:DNA mismatch repair protein MutS
VKPVFNDKKIMIKSGFHPSLIKLKNEIVRNDTEIENGTLIILTGANMSGKSTFLKYNAIILLLAQIGSYIPAQSADLTIVDKIFMRQGSTDDIVNNNSTFMVEMNDLKFIIDNATNSSIVFFG